MTGIDPQSVKFLLNERGFSVTFRRVTGQTVSDYDPASGSTTASSSNDDESVNAVFMNYSEREITGNVERGDRKVIMSNYDTSGKTLSKRPQSGDKIIGAESNVSVIDAKTLKDAGNLVGFVLQVRE